jgi:hypothetical protein
MPQRKKPLATTDKDLNAHEKLFAERIAQKVLAMLNDEWIAAGGARSIRQRALAATLRIALAGVGREL